MDSEAIEKAKIEFGQIIEEQLQRIEEMKKPHEWIDYEHITSVLMKTRVALISLKNREKFWNSYLRKKSAPVKSKSETSKALP